MNFKSFLKSTVLATSVLPRPIHANDDADKQQFINNLKQKAAIKKVKEPDKPKWVGFQSKSADALDNYLVSVMIDSEGNIDKNLLNKFKSFQQFIHGADRASLRGMIKRNLVIPNELLKDMSKEFEDRYFRNHKLPKIDYNDSFSFYAPIIKRVNISSRSYDKHPYVTRHELDHASQTPETEKFVKLVASELIGLADAAQLLLIDEEWMKKEGINPEEHHNFKINFPSGISMTGNQFLDMAKKAGFDARNPKSSVGLMGGSTAAHKFIGELIFGKGAKPKGDPKHEYSANDKQQLRSLIQDD